MEKIARFLEGEKGVESCPDSGCHGFSVPNCIADADTGKHLIRTISALNLDTRVCLDSWDFPDSSLGNQQKDSGNSLLEFSDPKEAKQGEKIEGAQTVKCKP